MQINITARHLEIPEPLKEYTQNKVEKLLRFHDRISSIDVVMEPQAGNVAVEILVKVDRVHEFVAKEARSEATEAVDWVVDKLERQLTKHKEKQRDHRH